jgi:DNA-binding LytR/AlgR family response regulator
VILRVLAVDDEPPSLDELAFLLDADERVSEVLTAPDAVTALRLLDDAHVDAVFLDIRMPGLSGLDLARVLTRFSDPPTLVFVTAYDGAAVDAFDLRAVDYLLKPLRPERLTEAVGRVVQSRSGESPSSVEQVVTVELGGVTRFVPLSDVRFVEAQGDYARLHTATGSHLLRASMAALEQRWASAGFVRIHRSWLVAASHISELRLEPGGGYAVQVGGRTLPVSRRHSQELKDRLVRRARGET